ncbi:MAG TPA: antibiotic biosynthesis monooxygenase family protein [Steroidobacteraceae bacterium]|jgi:quinol monooxygenase YgiN|nr:antibiotic biosynthesis monooxygenase family protein [Steroidobacteraceae bacterium]
MSTTFIAKLVVKPGMEATFENLQRELSQLTHAQEPDTLVYDVLKHRTQPHTYVVYGRFRDEAAFQRHQTMPFHDRLVPPILACLAQDMDLQFLDWRA